MPTPKLGQWLATAISGNDILSSVFYSAGIAIAFAGVYAPLVLLIVVGVLLLYKFVYTEVVEAAPVNGGAYKCLLNVTPMSVAACAGVMTILAYLANAVISAKVGVEYLATVVAVPILPTAVTLLGAFALLVMAGIRDSARVAVVLLGFHLITVTIFLSMGAWFIFQDGAVLGQNIIHTKSLLADSGGLLPALFLAFSASFLGVSGFEGSANFVEEQKRGVFRKTLRNMVIAVAILYPLMATVIIAGVPNQTVIDASDFLLARAARDFGGSFLEGLVVIDAFLVLSGAVLASYIGVSGLVSRMTFDHCLPRVFTRRSSGSTFPRIVTTFFVLCASMLVVTGGRLLSLAGMYTISFLGVMTAFAIGNFLLKRRQKLRRSHSVPALIVATAGLATTAGIIGNAIIDIRNLGYFAMYYIPAITLVLLGIHKKFWVKALAPVARAFPLVGSYLASKLEKAVI